jgi:hypothetical protein
MLKRTLLCSSLGFGGLAFVLVIVNSVLILENRAMQKRIGEQQLSINQGVQMAQMFQVLAQKLGNAALSANDSQIKDMLTANGISVTPPSAAAPAAKQTKGK